MKVFTVIMLSAFCSLGRAMNLDLFKDPKDVAAKKSTDSPVSNAHFVTTAWACPPSNLDALSANGYLKSQQGEDRCLFSFFNGLCGGKYMEMGALDGVRFSNTYAFYAAPGLDWRGVNVELTPENYAGLVVNRPHDIANVHAAVCDVPQTLHFVDMSKKVNAVSGIWEFASEAHRKQWFGGPELKDAKYPTTTIDCSPLQTILDNAVGTGSFFFDFYSLDIEGAELSALRSIDFTRIGFGILVVEGMAKAEDNLPVIDFLRSKGYDQFTKAGCGGNGHRNLWYINREFWNIYEHVLERQTDGYLRG